MATVKQPTATAVADDFASAGWHFYFAKTASGAMRLFCRVTLRDAQGRPCEHAMRFSSIDCAEKPKAKRLATKALMARALEMAQAVLVDSPTPVAVPADDDEVTP